MTFDFAEPFVPITKGGGDRPCLGAGATRVLPLGVVIGVRHYPASRVQHSFVLEKPLRAGVTSFPNRVSSLGGALVTPTSALPSFLR
jgi:hypothetical protein